jgi:predicted dehydrogenase
MALEAGKHVYCEKPISHNVLEGKAIVQAAARHPKQVFLTGTQHRSAPHLMEVERMVQGGSLRDVHFVKVWNYVNLMPGGLAERPDEAVPEGLDWDMYLGPAPYVPFNRARFLRSYRGFFDYAGGWITDFGVHRFDTIHQIMGQEKPLTVTAAGGRFGVGGMSDQPDVLQVTYEYPGFVMSYETINTNGFGAFARTSKERRLHGAIGEFDRPNGMAFYGSNGLVVADRLGYEVFPEGAPRPGTLQSGKLDAPELEHRVVNGEEPSALHAAHFIRCIREGEKPRTDAVTGHRASLIAHLGNTAYKTGRKLWWDAEREDFVDDSDASLRLGRKARPPWDMISL